MTENKDIIEKYHSLITVLGAKVPSGKRESFYFLSGVKTALEEYIDSAELERVIEAVEWERDDRQCDIYVDEFEE